MDGRFPRLLEARYIPKRNSLHHKLLIRGRTYPRQENPIRNTMTKRKIICIGLPKTGTISFCVALRKLGFSARHSLSHEAIGSAQEILEKYDAIAEFYGMADFEKMKKWYPDARLVWTKRDLEPWLVSCAKQYGEFTPLGKKRELPRFVTAARKHRFGQVFFERELFKKIYLNFYKKVEDYKRCNPLEDILEMDITKGDGYEKLCPFLDVPFPPPEFPHKNKGYYKGHYKGFSHDINSIPSRLL